MIFFNLNNIFSFLSEVNLDSVMSGYYVGYFNDLKVDEYGMLVIVEDVGIFFWVLNNGIIFELGE